MRRLFFLTKTPSFWIFYRIEFVIKNIVVFILCEFIIHFSFDQNQTLIY